MAGSGRVEMRALKGDGEWEAYSHLVAAAFAPALAADESQRRRWLRSTLESPDFTDDCGRGAFDGDDLLGGYLLEVWRMRLGETVVRTGCIGAVAVSAEHRMRGVGRQMLLDAVAEGRRRRCALLFLDGIARFYRPFGFSDVWDPETHHFARADAEALPDTEAAIRLARPEDARALAALYGRHFAAYTGSFGHSAEMAAYKLDAGIGGDTCLAVDRRGRVRGHLLLARRDRHIVREVAADDRDALCALLRHHARVVAAAPDAPETLSWQVPATSLTFGLLSDALDLRSEIRRTPYAGWMARPGHPRELGRAVSSIWAERARRGLAPTSGIQIAVDGVRCQAPDRRQGGVEVRLSGGVWLALAFGHRPVAWASAQPGQHVPRRAWTLLQATLPDRPCWVAGSDRF